MQEYDVASVAFFVLFPISMFANAAAFMHERKVKMGLFTLALAIPETISALSATAWAMVLGFNKQGKAARPHILHASFFNS
ncbi:MAG: hypothetical protein ABSC91_01140 [Candidatus Bathyarchaeia archaeon]